MPSFTVDLDYDEIFEEISTDILVKEIRNRSEKSLIHQIEPLLSGDLIMKTFNPPFDPEYTMKSGLDVSQSVLLGMAMENCFTALNDGLFGVGQSYSISERGKNLYTDHLEKLRKAEEKAAKKKEKAAANGR